MRGRTIDPEKASLHRAAQEVSMGKAKLKDLAARGEISCVNSDPWQFNLETLRQEIKSRKERILKEMREKGVY